MGGWILEDLFMRAPVAIAIQPMNSALMTVKNATSPSTISPVNTMKRPRRTQIQRGGCGKPVVAIGALWS